MSELRATAYKIADTPGSDCCHIADSAGMEFGIIDSTRIASAREHAAFIVRACNSHDDLLAACQAAFHALKSYEYGNSATDLAEETAEIVRAAIEKAQGGGA